MSWKPSEPMLVAMARFRLEWAKLWAEVAYSLLRWVNKEIPKHSRVIEDWERELREWGHESQSH